MKPLKQAGARSLSARAGPCRALLHSARAMTVEDAVIRARPFLLAGATHPDYARTVELATLYRRLATGNIGPLLHRHAREAENDFTARRDLTTSVVPSVWNALRTPFYQVARLKDGQVTKRFDYSEGISPADVERFTAALTQAVGHYYDSRSLEDYLAEFVTRTAGMTDPNAWLLTEFAAFDYRTQQAQPYPVLLPCEAAVDYTRQAGVTQSVTFRTAVEDMAAAFRFTVYLDNEAVDFWPIVDEGGVQVDFMPPGSVVAGYVADDTQTVRYSYRILAHNAGRVPASRIGYVLDELTEGRTFVSPLTPAIPYLLKELKSGSELEYVMSDMAFPHKLQYVADCPGLPGLGCVLGKVPLTGNTCQACHGSGKDTIQTSASEVLTFQLPKDPADIKLKLTEMLAFIGPGTDVPKLQMEYQESLVANATKMLFNSPVLNKATVTQTATERLAELDQKNIALTPSADCFSRLYVHHATVSAAYVDAERGLTVVYDFPADLQLESEDDLYTRLKNATESGAPSFVIEQIGHRIARKIYADNPQELRRYFVKSKFITFLGLSNDYVLKLATLGYITPEERVLRTHADSIFSEIEDAEANFYNLPRARQQELVDAKAQAIVAKLGPTSGSAFGRLNLSTTPAPAAPVVA